MNFLRVLYLNTLLVMTFLSLPVAANSLQIGYLEFQPPKPPVLSNVIPQPEDAGLQGALLGIADNNTTGRFMGQKFELLTSIDGDAEVLLKQAKAWLDGGISYLVVRASDAVLQQILNMAAGTEVLVFNAGSKTDALRQSQCQPQLLHTIPSYAMLADGLGQWLIARKLKQWILIHGDKPEDLHYKVAFERTAKRYGAKIVASKQWTFKTDLRRQAQVEVPLFTQVGDYDVVVVADEAGDFGEFIPYNTWLPRPVVGTQGLTPIAWHKVIEQWGAAQLQSRFEDQAGRWMNEADYAAWIAVRTLGEAAARINSLEPSQLNAHIQDADFSLGGFKGRRLSYRSWNGQLRQPIPLVHPRALVSQSPQNGYLHPLTDLDTLGFDKPEVKCR